MITTPKKLPVIVLAAGEGRRAGISKGLVEVEGRPWLDFQLDELKRAQLDEIRIVLGNQSRIYFDRLPYLKVPNPGLTVFINPDPSRGPFSSIQTALPDADRLSGAFVLPVDTPCPSPEIWESLSRALENHWAVVPRCGDRGGHPVLLSARFLQTLLAMPADSRLDECLRALPDDKIARIVVADRRVAMNYNTPEDFAQFKEIQPHENGFARRGQTTGD